MKNKSTLVGTILFVIPVLLIFLIWYLYPTIFLLYSSFTKFDAGSAMVFCGLENYIEIFKDADFIYVFGKKILKDAEMELSDKLKKEQEFINLKRLKYIEEVKDGEWNIYNWRQ